MFYIFLFSLLLSCLTLPLLTAQGDEAGNHDWQDNYAYCQIVIS